MTALTDGELPTQVSASIFLQNRKAFQHQEFLELLLYLCVGRLSSDISCPAKTQTAEQRALNNRHEACLVSSGLQLTVYNNNSSSNPVEQALTTYHCFHWKTGYKGLLGTTDQSA